MRDVMTVRAEIKRMMGFCVALLIAVGLAMPSFAAPPLAALDPAPPSSVAPPLEAGELDAPQLALDAVDLRAVGRLDFGPRGFCAATLIAPDLVLTAGHCLFDKISGVRLRVQAMQFMTGAAHGGADHGGAVTSWRVRRALAHPEYVYGGHEMLERLRYDMALVQLEQPIAASVIRPLTIAPPSKAVGAERTLTVVQAADKLQPCPVLSREAGLWVLSCDVEFGTSGAPVLDPSGGHIFAVVVAKAAHAGQRVTVSAPLASEVETLRLALLSG